jgi:hypothetical protein
LPIAGWRHSIEVAVFEFDDDLEGMPRALIFAEQYPYIGAPQPSASICQGLLDEGITHASVSLDP